MSNHELDPEDPLPCCLLGICCLPAAQLAAWTVVFRKRGLSEEHAATAALEVQRAVTEKNFKAAIAARDRAKD